jgi:hypothetical protein
MIELQQLTKRYGDLCAPPSRKLAVDGISATIRPDPPIASAMAHLPPRAVSRWRSVFASVIEPAFIESHAGTGILRTRSRPNWSISRCRSGCSSGFQPSSSSRSLSHRAATTRS